MIILIGVGHVFDIGPKVRRIIEHLHPDVVGVELDKSRYHALQLDERRDSSSITYSLLARFQERIASKYDSKVGQEMLAAIEGAQAVDAAIEFIDVDAAVEFTDFFKSLSLKERMKFVFGAIAGLFVSKKRVEKELGKFQENSSEYLEMFADQFPTVKKALIDDRDTHMATRLRQLATRHRTIAAVIGDGHVRGISHLLGQAGLPVKIIRLNAIRAQTADQLVRTVDRLEVQAPGTRVGSNRSDGTGRGTGTGPRPTPTPEWLVEGRPQQGDGAGHQVGFGFVCDDPGSIEPPWSSSSSVPVPAPASESAAQPPQDRKRSTKNRKRKTATNEDRTRRKKRRPSRS